MKFDFDKPVDRSKENSCKWNCKENELPMWVADMDFKTSSYVEDAIPGGPTERTIEYVAPFTRGNRELDYEVAWNYFSSIYKQD